MNFESFITGHLNSLSLSTVWIFLSILFLQSGFDKVFNRKDNLQWMVPHFANSGLKNLVPVLLNILTLLEIASGLLCMVGVFALFLRFELPGILGNLLSVFTFLCLFAGQRLARDYAGAASLASYFVVALAGLLFIAIR